MVRMLAQHLLSLAFVISPTGRVPCAPVTCRAAAFALLMSGRPIEVLPAPSSEEVAKIKGTWGTWGCDVSEFPWTYSDDETALLLEGEVTITPDDSNLPAVTIKAGDFVRFPAGMSCTWKVTKAINKHYNFG